MSVTVCVYIKTFSPLDKREGQTKINRILSDPRARRLRQRIKFSFSLSCILSNLSFSLFVLSNILQYCLLVVWLLLRFWAKSVFKQSPFWIDIRTIKDFWMNHKRFLECFQHLLFKREGAIELIFLICRSNEIFWSLVLSLALLSILPFYGLLSECALIKSFWTGKLFVKYY